MKQNKITVIFIILITIIIIFAFIIIIIIIIVFVNFMFMLMLPARCNDDKASEQEDHLSLSIHHKRSDEPRVMAQMMRTFCIGLQSCSCCQPCSNDDKAHALFQSMDEDLMSPE